MDIDEKYKKRQKIEKVLEKFRSLPEATHISKFLKFEKLNLKTQLYNKTNKLDAILKQLNADPTLQLQKQIDLLGGAPGSEVAKE